MSEALFTQWKDRVLEAEAEVGLVQEDIDKVQSQRRALKAEARRHIEVIEREKKDLLKRLEAVAAEANDLSALCVSTLSEKDKVEATYLQTLDEYENMHYVVRDIKKDEEHLRNREDIEKRLHRESMDWAEEEHTLRSKLNHLQLQLKQRRKEQTIQVSELESALASLEHEHRQARAARTGEARQHVRTVLGRESRQGTPLPSSAAPTGSIAASGGADLSDSANPNSSTKPPHSTSDAFVSHYSNTSVPMRANALRSCLKFQNAPPATAVGGSGSSGAPSRALSQPLLSTHTERTVDDPTLPLMRAYSVNVSGIKGGVSRPRSVLGESTNQQ